MKTLTMIVVTALLVLTGCGSGENTDDDTSGRDRPAEGITEVSTPQTRLLDAKERWANAGIDHYEWRYQRQCYCPGMKMDIEVNDGQVVTAKNTADPTNRNTTDVATMDDLFDQVEKALADSYRVKVSYDPATGAVKKLSVDHIKNAMDDEYTYVVKRVDPLS